MDSEGFVERDIQAASLLAEKVDDLCAGKSALAVIMAMSMIIGRTIFVLEKDMPTDDLVNFAADAIRSARDALVSEEEEDSAE